MPLALTDLQRFDLVLKAFVGLTIGLVVGKAKFISKEIAIGLFE